ncbi:EXOS4 protein, partial [Cepphus grylle]|nr:EXOS4 protein [Cepphus grylle]
MAAAELLSDEGYRADGRRPAELRKVRARMGVFGQADGSAYIEQGNTKALAVVYGPHEVSGGGHRVLPPAPGAPRALPPRAPTRGPPSIGGAGILQADGGNYCAGVNAATLAVMDAGIPMRDYVCASTAGLAEDTPLADLSSPEEAAGGPRLVLALLPATGQMALLQLSARLHQERLEAALEAAGQACRALHAVLDRVVRQRLREVTAALGD